MRGGTNQAVQLNGHVVIEDALRAPVALPCRHIRHAPVRASGAPDRAREFGTQPWVYGSLMANPQRARP